MAYTHWLVKAEPETRLERGVDVKFSIDDLERNRTTTWEGVRNHQAKKFLRDEMKVGHGCLFYASNCKEPGVRGIARVCKEGYPDYNAWDSKHPYYDPKSKQENPTWYMVDVEFVSKLAHPVPLALLQLLGSLATTTTTASSSPSSSSTSTSSANLLPASLSSYLTPSHLEAIHSSALLSRGRLSVQPVSDEFWDAVNLLGERGGWDEWDLWKERGSKGKKGKAAAAGGITRRVSQTGTGEDKDVKDEEGRATAPTKRKRAAAAVAVVAGDASGSAEDEVPTTSAVDDGNSRSDSQRKTVATKSKKKEEEEEEEAESNSKSRNTKRAKKETTDPVADDDEVEPTGTAMMDEEAEPTSEIVGGGGGRRRRNPARRSKA